tara:strand:+ start:1810 stop:2550 length:741 start_codon:yes stop_codon:yes gene_type:complete
MKLHENYVKELKKYYKNHRELPKDFDKGFFGRSTTETLIYSLPEDALWIDDEDDVNYRNCVPPGKEYSVNWYSIDQTTRGGYYSKSNSIGKEFSMIMYTRSYYFFEGKEFGVNEDMSFEELNDTIENDNPDYGHYTPECDFWTNSLDFNIKTFKPIKCAPIFKPNDYFEFDYEDIFMIIEPFNGKNQELHLDNIKLMNPFTGEYIPVWLVHKDITGTYFHNYKISEENADEEFEFYINESKKYSSK